MALADYAKELDGFDPLEGAADLMSDMDPNKPVILNVLNSYTGFFDLFSELVNRPGFRGGRLV